MSRGRGGRGESNGGPMKRRLLGSVLVMSIVLGAAPARAQLNGENLLGDTGVRSGTQPAPGCYAGFLYYRYDTDVIRNASGEQITLDQPTQEPDVIGELRFQPGPYAVG